MKGLLCEQLSRQSELIQSNTNSALFMPVMHLVGTVLDTGGGGEWMEVLKGIQTRSPPSRSSSSSRGDRHTAGITTQGAKCHDES